MIESDSSQRYSRRAAVGYLVAALSVSAALLLTWALKQSFPTVPNALYLCAIIVSPWVGGFGPGVVASILTSVAVVLTPPAATTGLPRHFFFLVAGIFISWLIDRQRRARIALRQAHDLLEIKVRERTATLEQANTRLVNEMLQRQEIEKALRKSETHLRLVIDSIPTMAWIVLPNGAVDFLNRRWLEYSGLSLEEALKEPTRTIHPDDIGRAKEKWLSHMDSGKPYEDEMRLRRADGQYRWFLIRTVPLFDESRKVCKWYGTSTDIEDRRRAEEALRETQAMLARVARVTTVGELTASIAHEVNQPLAAVVTNANASLRWLAATPPNLEEAREAVRRIIRDGNRAADVIARIRTLLKKGDPVRTPLSINEIIEETLTFVQPQLARQHVSLKFELATDLPKVPADRVQLQQVLLNLVVNSLDSLGAITDGPRVLRICSERDERESVSVAVQDTGGGVAPEDFERLFQPFFTTKQHGLGMGLTISRSIIEAHGGRLWMTLNNGPGVSFRFTLPAQQKEQYDPPRETKRLGGICGG
ncbi:MAG: nodV1 [Verrucomicrobiales bacterium]|nr:nodV1 [Verrucomicrobiales bacterium]